MQAACVFHATKGAYQQKFFPHVNRSVKIRQNWPCDDEEEEWASLPGSEAREVSLTGRSGIYDVRVHNQDGVLIAEMRGLSRAIKGQLFEENIDD